MEQVVESSLALSGVPTAQKRLNDAFTLRYAMLAYSTLEICQICMENMSFGS